MYLSSNDVALSLLSSRNASTANAFPGKTTVAMPKATSAEAKATEDSGDTVSLLTAKDREEIRASEEMMKMWKPKIDSAMDAQAKLMDGSVSPFDPAIVKASAAETTFRWSEKDPRMEFEGAFMPKFVDTGMGANQIQRDADFSSRSDAMAYAYHFATALAADAQRGVTDMAWINANSDTTRDASGRIYGTTADGHFIGETAEATEHGTFDALSTFRSMERNAATLANMFSLDASSVTTSAYGGSYSGFSLSHGTLGKIMDVAADGTITLYDAEGKGYSAAEYSAANIDGGIPQLRNDLIRQSDRQSAAA